MALVKLRDRDAILTKTGLIFRVYGYSHPSKTYICDPEYAPANMYMSNNPKALRVKGKQIYYKFYADEGLQFVREYYPQYTIWYAPLQTRLVGIRQNQIVETRNPEEAFKRLSEKPAKDDLIQTLHTLSSLIVDKSGLSKNDFGVFGSLLHGFYHPQYSDLDLIVYGREALSKLCQTLEIVYREKTSQLQNEFESEEALAEKHWKFFNYSPKEFVWHQRRKLIYGIFHDQRSHRTIKTEFEPVKNWEEIQSEYDAKTRILKRGWIKAIARVTDDSNASFIPSIYRIEPLKIMPGTRADDIQRIISYVEEFRMQAKKDEEAYVEGNLEQVVTQRNAFHQITLTYGPRYYEQVLKVFKSQKVGKLA